MKLKLRVPTEVLVTEEVTKIKAEAENGWFCVLPRHVDFVTSLVPGILLFETPGRQTQYVAIDRGILVKCGPEVCVSARNAVRGVNLGTLKKVVETEFGALSDKERAMRQFEAKLEADLVRRLVEMEKYA